MQSVVVVLGKPASLNGEVLTKVLGLLEVSRVHAAYLRDDQQDPQKSLVQWLLGAGEKTFRAASNVFCLATSCKPEEVQVVVVDTELPLGNSFSSGKYTELKELFPSLKQVIILFEDPHPQGKLKGVKKLKIAPVS